MGVPEDEYKAGDLISMGDYTSIDDCQKGNDTKMTNCLEVFGGTFKYDGTTYQSGLYCLDKRVDDLSLMFQGSTASTVTILQWDNETVTSMRMAFADMKNIQTLDLRPMGNCPNLNDATFMFQNCDVRALNLEGWKYDSLDCTAMFWGAKGLQNLVLTGWDMSLIHSYERMFADTTIRRIWCSEDTKSWLEGSTETTGLANFNNIRFTITE